MAEDAARLAREERLTTALVDALLHRDVDLRSIEAPSHYLGFLFDLLSVTRLKVTKVKWPTKADGLPFKRFDRFVDQLSAGLPALPVDMALHLAEISNTFMADTEDIPRYGFDVPKHFSISSSFGTKGKMLHQAVRYMRPSLGIEIGTAYGMSAAFFAAAQSKFVPNGKLWTIEAAEGQFRKSKAMLGQHFPTRVESVFGMSNDALPKIMAQLSGVDFYFHDGGHLFDNITSNFDMVRPQFADGALVVIDDIRWWDKRVVADDPRCYAAWERIYNDNAVTCAIEVNGAIGLALINA